MHALADAARCKQEEDASTLKQRRGRVVYNTDGEKPVKRPYVEKLDDAFSDSGLPRLDHSQGDLEGFTTRLAQHGQGSVLTSGSVQLQCRRRQAANKMSLEGSRTSTRRATGQPKGSIATSRPWRAVDKHPSPLDPLGSPLVRAASDAALARPPMSATALGSRAPHGCHYTVTVGYRGHQRHFSIASRFSCSRNYTMRILHTARRKRCG